MMTIPYVKSTITTASLSVLLVFMPVSAFAQTATQSAGGQEARLATLHTRCDTEINNRLTSLTSVGAKIQAAKKLSDTQKSQFLTQIQSDTQNLTGLKAKCDADTDVATLKTDILSIFTQYRVYAVFLPQTHLGVAADSMGVVTDKLNDFATKLQARIQAAQTAGKNVTALQTLLTDMQNKIKDAQTQYANVLSLIAGLTPSSYPATTTLQSARTAIKTGTTDLKTAWNDAIQIRQGLKALGGNASPSTTVTPTP